MICATLSRPYLLLDVGDDLVAMGFAEVDVEVRHRHALGIEEALEQQAERDRIEVGDGQRPGDDRAGAGAAARPDRDVVRLRPFDEVGDDQEVAGEAHAGDDVELVIEPLAITVFVLVAARPCSRASSPACASRRSCSSSSSPSRGRIGLRFGAATAQRCAMTAVLAIASGRSANSSAIAAPSLSHASADERDAVGAFDIGRVGDAQHRVVRGME